MKWQAISSVTSKLNEEAKGYLAYKMEKDAGVEIANLWSDFLTDTTKHLHQSQGNIEVVASYKTGGLAVVTQFDELHPDFLDNKKPFFNYFLTKYDQRAADYLTRAKNPLTQRILQAKIREHRISLAGQISHTEAKLIDGKRSHMAVEAIEKLKNATYDHPELYSSHLHDITVAIGSLSLLPLEKDKMSQSAREDLAYAAALGTLKRSPYSILNLSNPQDQNSNSLAEPDWRRDLSLEQRIKIEQQASNLLHHQQVMKQHQVSSLSQSHFASILSNGKGINGFDSLLSSSFDPDDPRLLELKEKEALHKQAFILMQQAKSAPFGEYPQILQQIAPKAGEVDYRQKEAMYHILSKQLNHHMKLAQTDPARLVEELYVEEIPNQMPMIQRYRLRKQLQEQKGIPSYAQKYLMQAEADEYLAKLNSKDVNQVKQTIDEIMSLRDDDLEQSQYGLEILEEILSDQKDLELLVHAYAENRLYNRKIAGHFLEMLPIKDQLFSSQEKAEFTKEIDNNSTIEEWSKDLSRANIQNEAEISQMRQSIRYLARYYQRTGDLSTKEAVVKASNSLISETYMRLDSKKLQIPKQIIKDGIIQDLNADYVESSLSELQLGIITGSMTYDYATSFMVGGSNISDDSAGEHAAARVRECLLHGRWKLTPDKKSVYYTFPTRDGRYLPIMAGKNQILKFDLSELNNPLSLERQKQRLLPTSWELP